MLTNLLIHKFIQDPDAVTRQDVRMSYGNLASITGIALNILLFFAKIIIGWLTASVAITADAINNLTDFSSSIISLIGFKMAAKPADKGHPFGHGRYEYLSGLIVSILILIIGVEILRSGISKILHPETVTYTIPAFIVMGLSIIIKLWMSHFYSVISKRISSSALIASAQDSKNDVITTAAVLAAALLSYFLKVNLDGIMAVLVALFIIWSGIEVLKETSNPLLGQALEEEKTKELLARIDSFDGVIGSHDLMVHDYGPSQTYASVHVEMDSRFNSEHAHRIIDSIEKAFKAEYDIELTIHLDPVKDAITDEQMQAFALENEQAKPYYIEDEIIEQIQSCLAKVHPQLHAKNFEYVTSQGVLHCFFDVENPEKESLKNTELKTKVLHKLKENYPLLHIHVTVD